MSLGTTESSTATLYAQAVNYAMSKGAVVVAAAGNDGSSQLITQLQQQMSYRLPQQLIQIKKQAIQISALMYK